MTDIQSSPLKKQQNRIMQALRKSMEPQAPNPRQFLQAITADLGGRGNYYEVMDNLQSKQSAKEITGETGIYNLMKEQAQAGNNEAAVIDQAITSIAGDDPQIYAQLVQDLHTDPESVDASNARAKVMKYAADRGIVPLSVNKAKADIARTKSDTEKSRADILKTYKELQEPSELERLELLEEQKKRANKEKLKEELPDLEIKIRDNIRQLNELIGNSKERIRRAPGFNEAVGFGAQKLIPFYGAGDLTKPGGGFTSGSAAADFAERVRQIKGKQFLEAYEQLKGGGQITEVEGAKAESAISRMSLSQSEPEFVAAVKEFRDVLERALQRAKEKAGVEAPAKRLIYNPETGEFE